MAEIQSWHLKGDWFDVCRCQTPCPCTFAQPPTEGKCEGILAWHITEGHYGDTQLDDLSVVAVAEFEGNIWAGEASPRMGMILDERADEAQREALGIIFGGDAGGWPGGFAEMVDEVLGVEVAPIDFQFEEGKRWSVEVPGKVRGSAEALVGPTSPDVPVTVHNAPGAEVGPGQVATYGIATEDEADAFGLQFSWPGRSSKHFPFEWSGPDEG